MFTNLIIGIVAAIHLGFLVLEMFLWSTPFVQNRLTTFPPEELSTILAGNQGLYNGFLAAGLIWGLWDREKSVSIWIFFLSCIILAGIYGSISLGRPAALLFQTLPAAFALTLLLFESKK